MRRWDPIGVGVVGLGFMGRVHVRAYRAADAAGYPCRLVAVCDQDPARRAGAAGERGNLEGEGASGPLFDPGEVRGYATPEELLADEAVQLVSICTPTDTHVELAVRALAAGKHVLVEKPLATSSAALAPLARAVRSARTLCMPALCMRFWPGWSLLCEHVRSGAFGAPKSAVFRRLGPAPSWSREFYRDERRTGGALFDLHVHDADFAQWCFGPPASVSSAGTLDHLTTLYRYPAGPPHVVAEGGWDLTPGFAFRMQYTVLFDQATLDYDLARTPALLLFRAGAASPIALPATTGYDEEIRHLLERIGTGNGDLTATLADALAHTHLLEAERTSLTSGAPVPVPQR